MATSAADAVVTNAESGAFARFADRWIYVFMAALFFVVISKGASAQDPLAPNLREQIRGFVPSSYDAIANRFDASAVPTLLEMAGSEDEQEHWVEVIGVLGVVGDEQVVDALIGIIENPMVDSPYISQVQHHSRREAMRALGILAGRTGSEQALDYLVESLDDGIWRRRNVLGVPAHLSDYDQYDRQLSIYAIFGLALSGHPRASDALRSLEEFPTSEQARLRDGLDDTLDTWLEVLDLVSERGIAGMYEYYENQRRIEAERIRRERGR